MRRGGLRLRLGQLRCGDGRVVVIELDPGDADSVAVAGAGPMSFDIGSKDDPDRVEDDG